MPFTVRIRQWDQPIEVAEGTTILDAAIDAGVPYPFGCQSGNCGACKSFLYSGEVEMSPYSDFALTDEEKAQGQILACRSVPWADCEVAWLDDDDIVVHPRRIMTTKIVALDDMTHDIKRVRLSIEKGGPFTFSAGQYASVTFAGQPARDYSMANRPDDKVLEFHIRRMAGGKTSEYVATGLKVGDTVKVEGPLGTSHLRDNHRGPIIAIAGGSGLAPIKSIVETALHKGMKQGIYLYFGVRDERDLYLTAEFEALAATHANFNFIPVLSEPSSTTTRRSGFVHEAALSDFDDLDGCKAYLAGPPVMVEAATTKLKTRGVRSFDIHADAFYTTAETAALQSKTGTKR
ncbi:MAG: 2Fe-2S iron-sulfur cluster-binding protein [Rhodospirillales bacterium]